VTRGGPRKPVDQQFGRGRLQLARAFLKAARAEAERGAEDGVGNPTVSHIVTATIAYADALTAQFGGFANQQDHKAVVKTLRVALRDALPEAQEQRLGRILKEKGGAQYGARASRIEDAVRLLAELEAFAAWAEAELNKPR
jgi:hypothetical protein